MELMYAGMTFMDFFVPFLIGFVVLFSLCWFMTNYEHARIAAAVSFVLGVFLGFIGGQNAIENRTADLRNEFNLTYDVVVTDGRLPIRPNDAGAVVLFKDGRSVACTVSTDADNYCVFCDGKELRPVNK